MRKTLDNANQSNSSSSPLLPFMQARLSANFADARERAVPIQAIAGDANGQLAVPGMRGFFWARRPNPVPGGVSIVIMFWAATYNNNTPKIPFTVGQVVLLEPANDTQPTQWMLAGVPPDGYKPKTCEVDPHTGLPITGTPIPFIPGEDVFGADKTTTRQRTVNGQTYGQNYDPAYWPASQNYDNSNSPFAGIKLSDGHTCYDPVTSGETKATPQRTKAPPANPAPGDLWQDPSDETVYRRTDRQTWEVLNGTRSGDFVVAVATVDITKGQVLYNKPQALVPGYPSDPSLQMRAALAGSGNTECWGRILGLATADRKAGELVTIQNSGLFLFGAYQPVLFTSANGTTIFLGSTPGSLSATPPAQGAVGIMQRLGTVSQQGYSLMLDLGPSIKRGASLDTAGAGRDPSDPGGGIYNGSTTYNGDPRNTLPLFRAGYFVGGYTVVLGANGVPVSSSI